MSFIFQPWQLLSLIFAGAMNQQMREEMEFLRTQCQVWKELNGKRRIRLNDDQRRRLAAKGKPLGRKRLWNLCTIFSPETLLRWHRELIARKHDYSDRRGGVAGVERTREAPSARL